MQIEIKNLLKKNAREGSEILFAGPADKSKIQLAEKELGITFPPSYREYLEEFGAFEIDASSFAGLTQQDVGESGDVVALTRFARTEHGLPSQYIALNFQDGDLFLCIDTSKTNTSGEAPVVLFDPAKKKPHGSVVAPSFGAYLTEYLSG